MRFHVPVLVGALLLALAVGGTARAQTPAAPPPSSEEQLLGILPYRLQQPDLPAGFMIDEQDAVTPAQLAFDPQVTIDAAQTNLRDIQRLGFLIGFTQAITPNEVKPVRIFAYRARLFTTERTASDDLHASSDNLAASADEADNPPLPMRLGDEALAVHVRANSPDSNNIAAEAIYWRRGRLSFRVLLDVLDGTESLDQLVPLAMAADQHAASVTPPAPSTSAVLAAAGTEGERVAALYALLDRMLSPSRNPIGLRPAFLALVSNADLILNANDPRATYTRLAQSWKRVTGILLNFNTLQGKSGDQLNISFSLSADATGATANVLDPEHQPGSMTETFALPQPLGDTSRLYHETYTGADGVADEVWRAIWTHGPVVLSTYSTGPSGDFTARQVADFAAQVDERFNQGALPGVLTQPLPPSPIPAPITHG